MVRFLRLTIITGLSFFAYPKPFYTIANNVNLTKHRNCVSIWYITKEKGCVVEIYLHSTKFMKKEAYFIQFTKGYSHDYTWYYCYPNLTYDEKEYMVYKWDNLNYNLSTNISDWKVEQLQKGLVLYRSKLDGRKDSFGRRIFTLEGVYLPGTKLLENRLPYQAINSIIDMIDKTNFQKDLNNVTEFDKEKKFDIDDENLATLNSTYINDEYEQYVGSRRILSTPKPVGQESNPQKKKRWFPFKRGL